MVRPIRRREGPAVETLAQAERAMDQAELLNREFLPLRARILEIAATLDRLDRAGGDGGDRRYELVRQALAALDSPQADRAEQVQLLFSRPYEDDWQTRFAVGR